MQSKFLSLAFFVLAAAAPSARQDTQARPIPTQAKAISQKTPEQKRIADLTAQIDQLKERLQNLETMTVGLQGRLAELERGEATTVALKSSRASHLDQLKSELAKFSCESDQNRAFAAALADGKPVHTYEGAGAMECTTRLKNIVERAVRSLSQE